ncbi:MAG: 2-hydroxy-3-oxopropionate reductase [bacterium]|nr:2-hydroxy-3-oxopropionate reductase [bacterium]MDE0290358.1 2-hydroxy-3-oxopropionate reductase [bacterium]MDE0438550.1 2-hydroxy-3-oxopropionate reductase [bacterium]
MRIGFIGTGIMGRPMAGRLQDAGHRLFIVKHRSAPPQDLLDAGAVLAESAKALAEASDVVFTMVPDTAAVENALFRDRGVAAGLTPGKVVIDMSSISPSATEVFAKRIRELGCEYLDAPVSGGDLGARDGTLSIMVGGAREPFERVKPLFDVMGQTVTLVGGSGSGQACKVANQMIVGINIAAVSEALVLSSKAGLDPVRVREALLGGFASSRILDVHGQRMIDRAFEPGGRIELHQKDLGLALAEAGRLGVATPMTSVCRDLMDACAAQGGAGWDHSALVRAYEQLADHKLSTN